MKKLLFWGIIMGVVAAISFGYQAHATDVGGQILTDTTWTLAGSPYVIFENILVNEGATLSIEQGVIVNGQNYNIQVGGSLVANGTSGSNILLTDVNMVPGLFSNAIININFTEINGGGIFNLGGNSGRGTLLLTNSKILNINEPIWFFTPTSDCHIEKNIFINSSGINVQVLYPPNKVYVKNNIFYNVQNGYYGTYAVRSYSGDVDTVIVEQNSFLDTDRVVLRLESNGNMAAINNFWNTFESTVIESMISDRNDDLGIAHYLQYEPILTAPHPDTPIPDFNQAPTSECSADQIVFDEVTPNGGASSDPDGSIVSYYWKLEPKTDPDNFIEAYGVNPTISGLTNGFYDMCLIVTDDLGATDIDCCLLAVAGSCSCTPSTIHVESIIPTAIKGNKGQKFGQVTVTVNDDCGNPVSDVGVTGIFTGDFSETLTVATGADGIAILTTSSEVKKPIFEFCVDSLSNGTLTYIPSDNVETCDGISR